MMIVRARTSSRILSPSRKKKNKPTNLSSRTTLNLYSSKMRKKTNRVIIIERLRSRSKGRRKELLEVGLDQEKSKQTNA